jgi:hypothetical protein
MCLCPPRGGRVGSRVLPICGYCFARFEADEAAEFCRWFFVNVLLKCVPALRRMRQQRPAAVFFVNRAI